MVRKLSHRRSSASRLTPGHCWMTFAGAVRLKKAGWIKCTSNPVIHSVQRRHETNYECKFFKRLLESVSVNNSGYIRLPLSLQTSKGTAPKPEQELHVGETKTGQGKTVFLYVERLIGVRQNSQYSTKLLLTENVRSYSSNASTITISCPQGPSEILR